MSIPTIPWKFEIVTYVPLVLNGPLFVRAVMLVRRTPDRELLSVFGSTILIICTSFLFEGAREDCQTPQWLLICRGPTARVCVFFAGSCHPPADISGPWTEHQDQELIKINV